MAGNEYAHLTEESFKSLFETYKKRIYGYVLTLTRSAYAAEEITQTIFIKLWLCRDAIDKINNLEGYIFAMAHNKTLNHLRKASNDNSLLNASSSEMLVAANNVEERLLAYDYNNLVEEAVKMLTPQRKLVFELSRTNGLKNDEIAAHLRLSPNTVKNHLIEALRIIRKHLLNNRSISILLSVLFFGK